MTTPTAHTELLLKLHKALDSDAFKNMKYMAKADEFGAFQPGELEMIRTPRDMLEKFEQKGIIRVGDYRKLKELMERIGRKGLIDTIEVTEIELHKQEVMSPTGYQSIPSAIYNPALKAHYGPTGNCIPEVLNDKLIARISKNIGNDWTILAAELDFELQDIQTFATDAPLNQVEQTRTMLSEWVRRNAERGDRVDVLISALKTIGLNDVASKYLVVPLEISGPVAREAFQKALEEGSTPVRRTRLMIVGQERVGKTSLMRNLTFQSFNSKEPSTEGINTSSVCNIDIAHAKGWHISGGDDPASFKREYEESMASEIDRNIQKEREFQRAQISPGSVPSTVAQEQAPPPAVEVSQKTDLQPGTNMPSQEPAIAPGITEARKRQLFGSIPKEKEEMLISIWDFAGQDLYYTTHQTFLSSRAIYVVVFNLCHDMDKPVPVEVNPGTAAGKISCEMTPIQCIDFWMRSIYTYTNENTCENRLEQKSPPIFVVGTHRNDVGGKDLPDRERKILINAIFTRIRKEIVKKPYIRHIVNNYYAIENSLECNSMKIKKLRGHIQNIASKEPYMGEQIPLRWLTFDKNKLKEVSKSTKHDGTPVLTLSQVRDGVGVTDETVLWTMLKFYHDLGHIIYFGGDDDKKSEGLRDVVILDPQWLIDAFKKVITVIPPKEQLSGHMESWNRLEAGILEDELINHMWCKFLPKKQPLLDLMGQFDLLCEQKYQQPQDGESCSTSPAVSYYVPSMLNKQTSQSNKSDSSNDQEDSSVFFVDFEGFLPDGLFHRLVVRALRWSQELGGTRPGLQYHRGCFFVDVQHEFVLQMEHKNDLAYIRVSVMRAQEVSTGTPQKKRKPPSQNVTQTVREFVEDNLKDLWIKRIKYNLSVQCPCKRGPVHFLSLDECLNKKKVDCRIYEPQICFDTQQFKSMFIQESSDEDLADKKDKGPMSDIHFSEIAPELGPEWETLSIRLGFNQNDVWRFKQCSSHVNSQICKMFQTWRQKRGENVNKMKDELIEALTEIGRCELAEKVRNY